MKGIIIAIDGYSSCGKSTLAKGLARELRYRYIDTGAMYRAVALYCMRREFLSDNVYKVEDIIASLPAIKIEFQYDPITDTTVTYLNGENIEEEIRDVPVSQQVTKVSQISEVRTMLVDQQQKMGLEKAIVMDGRDIGTRVFPDAELKLFVTADLDVRAERRYKQMTDNGIKVDIADVKKNLSERDFDDVNKGENPLKQAGDAIVLDNTHIGIQEQFEKALELSMNKIEE